MAVDLKKLSKTMLDEAFGKGRLDYLDQVCDPSFEAHDSFLGNLDLQAFERSILDYRTAFPDLKPTLLAICGEGDLVAMHWRMTGTHQGSIQGIPPTGNRVTVEGMSFDRYRGGKLVESWADWDALGLLQQIGIVPRMQRPAPQPGAQPQPQP